MDSGLNPLTVVSGNGQINLVHTLLEIPKEVFSHFLYIIQDLLDG
jgi:hypothetical protein